MKEAVLLVLLVCCAQRGGGRLVPFTPCGNLFNYFESETYEIFGAMTFKNDLSGKYHLKVTMSIPTKTDQVRCLLVEQNKRRFASRTSGSTAGRRTTG